jgi:hypothetical protein
MSTVAFLRMPAVMEAIGVKSTITARRWCERHGVEVIQINSRANVVRKADFEAAANREIL